MPIKLENILCVPDQPYHPTSQSALPYRLFGQSEKTTRRCCQIVWFGKWTWLHYQASTDNAFCHTCCKALIAKKVVISTGNWEPSFTVSGFSNWKDATRAFKRHDDSEVHKHAVEKLYILPTTTKDIGESLNVAHRKEKQMNREYFLKVLQNIRFLARQGIALRGDGNEDDSNFIQLLKLRASDDSRIHDYLSKKTDKYTSPTVVNEIIAMMALRILRQIADCIQNGVWYSIMADEVTDSSNKEQLIICLRWVDNHLNPHEEFIGLYSVDRINAATLVHVIKDTLIRLNLKLEDCRGQCYDGAANMCGIRSGVATQISSEESRALFTHCYGHSLDLAACDTIKNSKVVKNALDVTYEICKLLKYSPRRDSMLDKIKKDVCPGTVGFRVLCPTRWTVRAASLSSVIENYTVFQDLWPECLDCTKDTETKARILGAEAQMKTFNYLFGILLGEVILRNTDNLSRTLQHQHLSAAEGQHVVSLTVKTLEKIRTDDAFELFWGKATLIISKHDISEPDLPRRRKAPRRYEVGESSGDFHDTSKS